MIEIGIGVLFAVVFIAAYLLVKKVLGSNDDSQSRWRELSSHQLSRSKQVAAKPQKLFLTSNEMREHHSQAKGKQPEGK